jgi:mannose-6-phosphate isomerase-like protein (cupin superfamily)
MEHRNRERDAAPFVTKDGSTIREYFHTERQSLAEASLEPRQTTQRHYHERSEEIYLIVEGGGELEVDGDRREVAAGDAVLVRPGAWHELTAGGGGVRLLCCCVPPYSDADTYFA